ncbi:MAG: hypothetical protein VX631_10250 [Pseudomonadota bacterium]|nr:hypothetical protein [Pseudomonadota bacterium]
MNKKVIYKRATSLMGWAQCALGHIPEHPAPASLSGQDSYVSNSG